MGSGHAGHSRRRLAAEPAHHPRPAGGAAGRQRTLCECLDADLRLARSTIRTPDFLEGVRAALVDKDRTPAWQYGY
ncbi:enoyl-CoA hydratase/isomerase family protein [Streptomyces sp. NBC_00842]|uniref:enoyl-CoA hydratase/isomerase family protein n=1 Tax=unclassified Streptomyces TaxID=2593676 RepID=UPI003865B14F